MDVRQAAIKENRPNGEPGTQCMALASQLPV